MPLLWDVEWMCKRFCNWKEMKLQGRLFAEKERSSCSFLHFPFQPATSYTIRQLCTLWPEHFSFFSCFLDWPANHYFRRSANRYSSLFNARHISSYLHAPLARTYLRFGEVQEPGRNLTIFHDTNTYPYLPPFVRPHWHTYFRMHIQIYTYR